MTFCLEKCAIDVPPGAAVIFAPSPQILCVRRKAGKLYTFFSLLTLLKLDSSAFPVLAARTQPVKRIFSSTERETR
jgi:hypothetical protein